MKKAVVLVGIVLVVAVLVGGLAIQWWQMRQMSTQIAEMQRSLASKDMLENVVKEIAKASELQAKVNTNTSLIKWGIYGIAEDEEIQQHVRNMLETKVKYTIGGLETVDKKGLYAYLSDLEKKVNGLNSVQGQVRQDITAVRSDVKTVESKIGNVEDAVLGSQKPRMQTVDNDGLVKKVNDLRSAISGIGGIGWDIDRISSDVKSLNSQVVSIEKKVDDLRSAISGIGGIGWDVDSIQADVKTVKSDLVDIKKKLGIPTLPWGW